MKKVGNSGMNYSGLQEESRDLGGLGRTVSRALKFDDNIMCALERDHINQYSL